MNAELLYGKDKETTPKHDDPVDPIAAALYGVELKVAVKVQDTASLADRLYGAKEATDPEEQAAAKTCALLETLEEADDAKRARWHDECHQHLREVHGDQAEMKLDAAREFLESHPKLASALEKTGLGNHKDVVTHLISEVEEMQKAGKWKSKKGRT